MSAFKKLPRSYQVAFIAAVSLHVGLLFSFAFEAAKSRPVMQLEAVKTAQPKTEKIVQAESIDSQAVEEQVKRLQAERAEVLRKENQRKEELARAERQARQRRIEEARKLERLKAEQAKLAAKRKAEMLEEQKRLKELQEKKIAETKRLEALKQEQLALKKAEEEARAKALEIEKAEKARQEALNRARISGVVDKYKALILNAIGQQWILPDQVNPQLSSQFKIRLAPNGSVLDVTLTKSSGDPVLDRSAEAAIYKASPLPVPSDAEMFNLFREISLTVRPESVRG